jgi:uncharacterized membrane protein YkvA (DUF1232 family)
VEVTVPFWTSRDPDERVTIEVGERERRFYDRLRTRVVRREYGEGSGLADLLLLIPDVAVLLARLARDPRVPIGAKAIAACAALYVVSPIDLVPEIFLGPVGVVDDLVVMAAALSRLVNYVHPDVLRHHWSGQGDVLEVIQQVTRRAESLVKHRIPATLRRLLGRTA